MKHPSILHFKGINFQSLLDPQKSEQSILMDYMPNVSIKDILNKERLSYAPMNQNPTKKYINHY